MNRKTLIVAGFAAFLLAVCVATFCITNFVIEQRDTVAAFFCTATLMMAIYMFVWLKGFWVTQIKKNRHSGPADHYLIYTFL